MGGIGGRRRRGQQRMRWLDGITDSMDSHVMTRWVSVNSGVGDGQGGLACYDSWGRKESDTTERLIWSDLNPICDGIWRWGLWEVIRCLEGGALLKRIFSLIKETPPPPKKGDSQWALWFSFCYKHYSCMDFPVNWSLHFSGISAQCVLVEFYSSHMFSLLSNCHTVFITGCTILHSHQQSVSDPTHHHFDVITTF